jgi:endonuclease/exonuclease/phosphatase (EEP) superfamily protein YafD
VGVAARYLPITNHATLVAALVSPYLVLSGPLALVVMLLIRRWITAIAAAGLTLAGMFVQLPIHLGDQMPVDGTPVRIMTANLKLGSADADALVSAARSGAELLAVQELTYDAVDHLSKAGLDAAFPYRAVYPQDHASGAGLWSRFPISSATPIWGFEMIFISARIHMTDVAVDPNILVGHVSGPWPQPIKDWREDIELLSATMDEAAQRAGSGAVVVAGDFNSTIDMRPFRQLLRDGYSDAAEQAGAGMAPTYPAGSWLPPLLGIDHFLVRNCVASAVTTAPLPGSDHQALVATIEIP